MRFDGEGGKFAALAVDEVVDPPMQVALDSFEPLALSDPRDNIITITANHQQHVNQNGSGTCSTRRA